MNEHGGQIVAEQDGLTVIECRACAFKHLQPLPSPDALRAHYVEHEYTEAWLAKENGEAVYWHWLFERRLKRLERTVRTGWRGEERKPVVLDVGCGQGLFLEAARTLGWDGMGVEPNALAADRAEALGLMVARGFFPKWTDGKWADEKVKSRMRFDTVHMRLFLEHVPDPAAYLDAARELLRPGGALCVEVPNDFSQTQVDLLARRTRTDGAAPRWWLDPRHVNYFDAVSLKQLVTRHGFRVERCESTFPMEWFALFGPRTDYLACPDLGPEVHKGRMRWEVTVPADFLDWFYGGLARFGMGRHVVVYATRRD